MLIFFSFSLSSFAARPLSWSPFAFLSSDLAAFHLTRKAATIVVPLPFPFVFSFLDAEGSRVELFFFSFFFLRGVDIVEIKVKGHTFFFFLPFPWHSTKNPIRRSERGNAYDIGVCCCFFFPPPSPFSSLLLGKHQHPCPPDAEGRTRSIRPYFFFSLPSFFPGHQHKKKWLSPVIPTNFEKKRQKLGIDSIPPLPPPLFQGRGREAFLHHDCSVVLLRVARRQTFSPPFLRGVGRAIISYPLFCIIWKI